MAGITSTKKIKGQPHLLAYITPNEVEKLKALGGQETMTKEGIPAYPESDYYGVSQDTFNTGTAQDIRSESTDPNVRRRSTFETYKGGKNIGVDNKLKAKYVAERAKNEEDARKKRILEIQAKKAQEEVNKGNYYNPNKNQNFFERTNTKRKNYNRRVKLKNLQRYQRDKINLLNKNLQELEPGLFYGDTMEEYDDFINMYAPSVTKYGPEGTGKYSQQFIDDVLSGKRPPPKSTLDTGIPTIDFINSKINNVPITKEYLMDLYSGDKNSYIRARDFDVDTATGKEMMEEFEPNRYNLQYNNNMGGGGGGGQEYLPYLPPEETDEVVEETTFPYHLGLGGQKVGRDVTLGYLADGGRVPRNMGGIMNAVPRQGYFLGKIVKGVGKAIGGVADAAGKVLKSDLGKAAIAGAMFYYGGGGSSMFKSGGLKGMAGNFFSKANPLLFTDGKMSMGKLFGLSAVAPYLFGEAKPNEDIGMTDRGGRLIDPLTGEEGTPASMRANIENAKIEAAGDPVKLAALNQKYNNMLFSNLPYENYGLYANGGRIGYGLGNLVSASMSAKDAPSSGATSAMGGMIVNLINKNPNLFKRSNNNNSNNYLSTIQNVGADVRRGSYDFIDENMNGIDDREEMFMSKGGRIKAEEGGLMDLGGMEKDYRNEGGFVPIGKQEKADDVPARLSVNEFVFTADAVRNAGGGDIDKGAEVMENMMKNLENGGTVSKESQGNTGAQQMFSVSERIGEVI